MHNYEATQALNNLDRHLMDIFGRIEAKYAIFGKDTIKRPFDLVDANSFVILRKFSYQFAFLAVSWPHKHSKVSQSFSKWQKLPDDPLSHPRQSFFKSLNALSRLPKRSLGLRFSIEVWPTPIQSGNQKIRGNRRKKPRWFMLVCDKLTGHVGYLENWTLRSNPLGELGGSFWWKTVWIRSFTPAHTYSAKYILLIDPLKILIG